MPGVTPAPWYEHLLPYLSLKETGIVRLDKDQVQTLFCGGVSYKLRSADAAAHHHPSQEIPPLKVHLSHLCI